MIYKMPLFRRKTAERQNKPPTTIQNVLSGTGLKRTPSNRSERSLPHSPKTPDSWGDDNDLGVSYILNGAPGSNQRPRTLTLSETVLQDGPELPPESLESPMRTSSRLSKTLLEVLRDKDALSCFKSFMKSHNAENIIQFWCDAESFYASTLMRLRTHSMQNVSKSVLHRQRTDSLRQAITQLEQGLGSTTPVVDVASNPDHIFSELSQSKTSPLSQESQQVRVSGHNAAYLSALHQTSAHDGSVRPSNSLPISVSPLSPSNQKQLSDENVVTATMPNSVPHEPVHRPHQLSTSCNTVALTFVKHNLPCDMYSAKRGAESSTKSHEDSSTQAASPQPSGIDINEATPSFSGGILKSPSESSQEDIAAKLKKSIERDAVTIFSSYIAKDAPKPIGVDDTLRSEAISKICKEDGEVDPECFVGCQKFVLDRLDSEYFPSFRDSEFHCRHQVNVLTMEKVYLPDILFNENALCYFMEFMEQEEGSDLMQMWLAADNFQQQLSTSGGTYDGEQAQIDAMVVYDRYFSLQATNPIGFDDKLRFEIEVNICREGGPLPDCFTKAKNIVLKTLEKLYFPGYLQSQIYYCYLSDLLSTVQMAEDMPNKAYQKGHRRAESDASSEHSTQSTGAENVVSRNTLLAVDTRKLRKLGTIEGDFSMNLDMLNPDDLWKRPCAKPSSSITSDLSLGRVNELGQFLSKFEHDAEAEKRKGPVLFKRRKEKEKEEEEMALRIAQMIISDVNTMTKTGQSMAADKPNS